MYRTDHQSLREIGLNWNIRHLAFLIGGLAGGILALGFYSYLRSLWSGEHWHLSASADQPQIWQDLYWVLPGVVVQELMFRGYLFTKTIRLTNIVTANIIFAILFTLVHVIDRDALQNPGQVIFLLLAIPIGHLLFSTALLRSGTLYFSIRLHWGNNWASAHLVGNMDRSGSLLYTSGRHPLNSWPVFIIYTLSFCAFYLLLTWGIWKSFRRQPLGPGSRV